MGTEKVRKGKEIGRSEDKEMKEISQRNIKKGLIEEREKGRTEKNETNKKMEESKKMKTMKGLK
jgi:hypothetical protein